MIDEITENIVKLSFSKFGSNVYLLKKEKIIIDTSSKENKEELLNSLKKLNIKPEEIKTVLLTHCHYDHIGNIGLFKNAKIYAHDVEIKDFQKNKNYFGPLKEFDNFDKISFLPLSDFKTKYIEVIETPGHTRGSVCFFLPKQKILFSGDTIFGKDKTITAVGRTDLPTSVPEQFQESINKLRKLKFDVLCAGH